MRKHWGMVNMFIILMGNSFMGVYVKTHEIISFKCADYHTLSKHK
jgi:hypothetical protein